MVLCPHSWHQPQLCWLMPRPSHKTAAKWRQATCNYGHIHLAFMHYSMNGMCALCGPKLLKIICASVC